MLKSPPDEQQPVLSRVASLTRLFAIILICPLAALVRCFSVIEWDSVIHEFDPYFNVRATKQIALQGVYNWWNWYDARAWYPLGRHVGQTLYPGLMLTAYSLHVALKSLGFPFELKDICVFVAPIFSGVTAIATLLLVEECTRNSVAGMLSMLFVALSPAYMSRSVAGSYDNEAVAITAIILVFYTYIRAVRLGTITAGLIAAFAYLYMVSSWGGYVFVLNSIAIYTVFLMLFKRYTLHHYVAYTVYYILGTMMCLNVPFVGLQAIKTAEHLASHCVFVLVQTRMMAEALQFKFSPTTSKKIIKVVATSVPMLLAMAWLVLTSSGKATWAGRTQLLLDPTYAARNVPIIASVTEHQSSTWGQFSYDLHPLCCIFMPVGLWLAFRNTRARDASFLGITGLLASYFSAVMIRLILILSPMTCALSGLGIASIIEDCTLPIIDCWKTFKNYFAKTSDKNLTPRRTSFPLRSVLMALLIIGTLCLLCVSYIQHGVFAAFHTYSRPTIILGFRPTPGKRVIIDDFREAYYWLSHNTHDDAKILSWWDYGYQSAEISNRTGMVDNNTWNSTHIATVGLILSSPEMQSHAIASSIDVDYILVIYGGLIGYNGDDINKMYWMIKISAGVYPEMKELFAKLEMGTGELKETVLHKFSQHQVYATPSGGYDAARRNNAPRIDKLSHFTEVFTSANYLVRIYAMNPHNNVRLTKAATTLSQA